MDDPPQIPLEREDSSESAERIMHAAIRLFGRKGYAATSVREIVQEAQVTNPMLYYYFESKEGLFHSTLHSLFSHRDANIRAVVESDAAFEEKLRAIVRLHIDSMRDKPEVVDFVHAVIFGSRDSQPQVDVLHLVRSTSELLSVLFEQAIESGELVRTGVAWSPEFLANTFLGMIGMHLMHAQKMLACSLVPESEIERNLSDEAVEQLISFFLNGAGESNRRQG